MNRRVFIRQTLLASLTTPLLDKEDAFSPEVRWEIGCFNRPWTRWTFDQTLREIRSAGFRTVGLLTRTREEPFIGAEAAPEYLEGLKRRIAASDLTANMGALSSRHDIPFQDSIREVRKQIDNAAVLSLKFVLSFGTDKPQELDHYARVMRDAAAYAEDKGIRLAMKPHGGISGASGEILRVIGEINHRNFSIWYDAGNIIYYTGKDPVVELEPVARHVSGFCAKDCAEVKGDVMIQFGAGRVDFAAVLRKLNAAGFSGPVMVECCKVGQTPEETSSNARGNRRFIGKILESL